MNPLQRLYKTKFTLLAVVSTAIGAASVFLAHWATAQPGWAWVQSWPVNDVGLALLTTGLFGVLFQYVGQRDAEEDAVQRLRTVLHETAPDIRDAVVEGFAFTPGSLTNVASPETLDRVVENCLAIRLKDKALATDIYADLREQIIGASERRYDVNASIALSPWEHGPKSGKGAMFVATVTWEYRVTPSSPVLRFSCVSDLEEYDEVRRDPTSTATWYFEPIAGLKGSSDEAFQLVQVAVNGKAQAMRRTTRVGSQVYTVNIKDDFKSQPHEVTISYTYRVLVQQNGHMLHLDVSRPTKGLRIQLAYGGCGIRYVNVLDYIASSTQPRVSRLPASGPTPSVDVSFDGWVLPKAGVAFVWVLDSEMAGEPK
jgi:hypothetical protein